MPEVQIVDQKSVQGFLVAMRAHEMLQSGAHEVAEAESYGAQVVRLLARRELKERAQVRIRVSGVSR